MHVLLLSTGRLC